MTYSIVWDARVRKDLKHLAPDVAARLVRKTETALCADPFCGTALKGDFQGLYRYRVGDYRVIYAILRQEITVHVVKVGHRREVYQ